MDNKRQQLQWLLDNADDIEIKGVYPDDNANPTLLIIIKDWDKAEESGFEEFDSCIMFE